MQTVKHLRIKGRVQGIGYRYHMQRMARDLDVTGWVRNRHDGSVEAIVAGTADAVGQIIAWAERGPAHAVVTNIEVCDDSGNYSGFEMLPTA